MDSNGSQPNAPEGQASAERESKIAALEARVESMRALLTEEIQTKASLERALFAQSERYLDLVERAPWIVVRLGPDGVYTDVNRCFVNAMGGEKDDYLDIPVGTKGEPDGWVQIVMDFVRDPERFELHAEAALHIAGGERWFSIQLSRSVAGGQVCLLAADQTEQREALHSAQSANMAKTEFLAVMSHEIRTPLNGVLGANALLSLTGLDAEQRELVSVVDESGSALTRLVNDMLDLTRFGADAVDFENAPLEPRLLLKSVKGQFRSRLQAMDVQLTSRVAETVPDLVVADFHRLRQVVSNLVDNALKFTAQGKVSISMEYRAAEQELEFAVEDTGSGIANDRLEQMFVPFSQLDNSSTRQTGGTGMGLSIARRLCEGMGGGIVATSDVGKGSVFYATVHAPAVGAESICGPVEGAVVAEPQRVGQPNLPYRHGLKPELRSSREPAASIPTEKVSLAGLRVLVVEDNAVNQRIAKAMLGRFDCSVKVAENGAVAVDLVADEAPDVILMDLDMPVMDGLSATRVIRNSGSQSPPIVAVTANAITGNREICLEAGMDDYLCKPYSMNALFDILARWTQGRGEPRAEPL